MQLLKWPGSAVTLQTSKTNWIGFYSKSSAENSIQKHHTGKAYSRSHGSKVGVLSFAHLRHQLLHHHIEHGSSCKGKEDWKKGCNSGHKDKGHYGTYGLHYSRQGTQTKGPELPLSITKERHCHHHAF